MTTLHPNQRFSRGEWVSTRYPRKSRSRNPHGRLDVPWLYGVRVRVRKAGRIFQVTTRHGASAEGPTREAALAAYATRRENAI